MSNTNNNKKLSNLAKTRSKSRGNNQNRRIKSIVNRAKTLKLKTPPSPENIRQMERLANALKNFTGGRQKSMRH